MGYLLAKILVCLCIAALIGAVVGWWLRRFRAVEREAALRADIELRDEQAQSLETLLSEQEKRAADLDGELTETRAQLPLLQATIDERDEQVMSLSVDLDKWKQEVPSLQSALQAARTDMQDARTTLEVAEDRRRGLAEELNGLRSELEGEQARAVASQASFDRLRAEMAQQAERMHHLNASIASLNDDLRDRDVKLATLQDEFDRVRSVAEQGSLVPAASATAAATAAAAIAGYSNHGSDARARAADATQWQARLRMESAARRQLEQQVQRLGEALAGYEQRDRQTRQAADRARVERLTGVDSASANSARAATDTGAIAAAMRSAALAMESAAGGGNRGVRRDAGETVVAPASAATIPALGASEAPQDGDARRGASDQEWRARLRIAESARRQVANDARRKDERIAQLERELRDSFQLGRLDEDLDEYDPGFPATPPADIDDLTGINGVGAVLCETLNDMGIYQFRQVANFTAQDIRWVDQRLPFKGRIERDDWRGQARALHEAKYGRPPDEDDRG